MAGDYDYYDELAGADPSRIEDLPWGSDPEKAMEIKREREEREVTDRELMDLARDAKEKAYCPRSGYSVGAAILTEQGIYTGSNIEVTGFSTSVHAEMLSVFKAVMDGAEELKCLAVSPQNTESPINAPCGLCQHTLSEFCNELRILEDTEEDNELEEFWLSDLIGDAYSGIDSKRERE